MLPGPAKRGRPEDDGSRKFFDDNGFEAGLRLAATTRPGIELTVNFTSGAPFELP